MDNDTLQMSCERAEDELSGYLDDVLDPPLRRDVESHLETCDRCREILDDFRRGDELLRAMPFIEPPADMHERFFNSPRYVKLTNARARERSFVTPLTAALVAAAMLVLALGGALLFRQGFLATQQATHPGKTTTIGNPGGDIAPLPAGVRLIYERGGALWSAPESGVGLPQQLTPGGVQVAGWSVSPNGRMVIYIDARTGTLHSLRADALNDKAIGTVTDGVAPDASFWTTPTGVAIADGIVWSPDNTRVAYVAQSDAGTALHVMNATGAADISTKPSNGALIGHPLWSADSVYVAYTTTQAGIQSIQVFNVTTAHVTSIAAQSDANDATATVGQLAWAPGQGSAITWSAHDEGVITGIFRADANISDAAVRLTPAGTSYTAADVSASGAWLLAKGPELFTVAPDKVNPQHVVTLAHTVTQVRWSPSGSVAAVVAGDALTLLTPTHTVAVTVVAHGLTAESVMAWSPDSAALAWQSGAMVMSARVLQGTASKPQTVVQRAGVLSIIWSDDGQTLAVRSESGMVLMSADGAQVRATDGYATDNGQFAWSVAG